MDRITQIARLLLLAFAAGAGVYIVASWLQPQRRPQELVRSAAARTSTPVPTATVTATTATPGVVVVERDPTLELPQRQRVIPAPGGDAFAPVSWLPPPPKEPPAPAPAAPAPPPAPTVPPLPFTFVGLLEPAGKGSKPKAFLSRGETLLVVAAGDTLENNSYRVDSINSQQITLTYLPMATQQTLNIPGVMR